MALTVREYLTADGKNPFREWLGSLTKAVRARIQARVLRFELGNLGDHKSLGEGVWEARVMFGPGYRIYFGKDGDSIVVLLVGGDKGSQAKDTRGHEDSGATIWRRKGMARRSRDWNVGLAEDLRDREFAREFLLGAIDEGVPLQVALAKVARAMGVKEFAAKVGMASPNLLRTLNPRHNPTQDTLNRLLKPFRLKLSLAPISDRPKRRHAA
jgi:putative addiction module killer protein